MNLDPKQANIESALKFKSHKYLSALVARAALRYMPAFANKSQIPETRMYIQKEYLIIYAFHLLINFCCHAENGSYIPRKSITKITKKRVNSVNSILGNAYKNTYSITFDFLRILLRASEIPYRTGEEYKNQISNTLKLLKEDSLFEEAMEIDITNLETSNQVFLSPLWKKGELSRIPSASGSALEDLEAAEWAFWRDWYQGFIDGKPLDWELQRRVALIPGADWEKGPAHIAKKIEEIKAQFLAEKAPLAETVEFNEETAKFHTVPREIAKPDLLGATLSQVGDALDDVLADPGNGLNDRAREVRVLRRTAAKYGNDPQRVEMDFTSVHAGLTRQIVVTKELPPSEGNLALQRALEEGAQSIRATHPEVEENRRILTSQKLKEMDAAQKAVLAEAKDVLVDISEGQLREDFEADISAIVEGRAPYIPPMGAADRDPIMAEYNETIRVLARVAKIGVLLRQTPELIHKIDKSAAYKGARILATIAAIITIGIALF